MTDLFRVFLVVNVPEKLEQGILYLSKTYGTSIHICACGCGYETVLPFGDPATGWTLTDNPDGTISFAPSIGNFNFPCRSHYFIEHNRVRWA